MKGLRWIPVLLLALACGGTLPAQEKDNRVYELRIYYAAEGKLDDLQARFRNHTTKLFEKHGITNVGYWLPLENPEQKLIYLLSFPNREAQKQSWKGFISDPDWQNAYKESEVNGKLVAKIESKLLETTDYSPTIKISQDSPTAGASNNSSDKVFELRTYTTTTGNLPALNSRFRDHTVKLFEKHGMTNIGYWVPLPGQKGADDTLIYLLAHKSVDDAKASFGSFRTDPDWVAARKASEEKAGGSLTTKDGVQSLFMKATDYSPSR